MIATKEISEVAQPYSIKIERGQKGGYGYEIAVKSELSKIALLEIFRMRKSLEAELYGNQGKLDPV